MTRITLLAAIATALLAIVASGCGSSDSPDDGVAALETGPAAAAQTDTTEEQTEEDPQEAALKWARCMREHGIDVPDPQVDEDGGIQVRAGQGGFRRGEGNDDEFREAQEACGSPLGNARPQLTEAQREELQETMLEFAKCMRKEGIDMPDPDFSGGGGVFRARAGGGGVDPDDPDFQAAQKECEPILQELQVVRSGQGGQR
jgi:hypothetical protein